MYHKSKIITQTEAMVHAADTYPLELKFVNNSPWTADNNKNVPLREQSLSRRDHYHHHHHHHSFLLSTINM